MNFRERATDHFVELILKNESDYPLGEVLDGELTFGAEIAYILMAHGEEKQLRLADFELRIEKIIRRFVDVCLSAEVAEYARELEQDAAMEAAEARTEARMRE